MTAPSDSPAADTSLDFTGERFTPECVREIWYEHWHRYVFASPLAEGRRVLDAACGEGYGSALLAGHARSVTGVDLDADTIAHAERRYGSLPGLRFRQGSVTAIDADDDAFDLIVSFETIEHLHDQERMLDEFRRVLAPDGLLVISSPDRDTYNAGGEPNPFHVRELDRGEFTDLLTDRFPHVRLYGQRLGFHSLVWRLDGEGAGESAGTSVRHLDADTGELVPGPGDDPVYYLAVCAPAADAMPDLPALSLFADKQASVYNHYNTEIARLIRADHRIIALERELAELKARFDVPR